MGSRGFSGIFWERSAITRAAYKYLRRCTVYFKGPLQVPVGHVSKGWVEKARYLAISRHTFKNANQPWIQRSVSREPVFPSNYSQTPVVALGPFCVLSPPTFVVGGLAAIGYNAERRGNDTRGVGKRFDMKTQQTCWDITNKTKG